MKQEIYERFYSYLCEVVELYQAKGNLKNFSDIAKKWGVAAITKDLFYENALHILPKGTLPTREQSDLIRNTMSRKDKERLQKIIYKDGDIIAWERNGFRSVAVMRADGLFSICLNYRNREDEQNRLWEVDSIPQNVTTEKANSGDLKRLVLFLVKDCYKENCCYGK